MTVRVDPRGTAGLAVAGVALLALMLLGPSVAIAAAPGPGEVLRLLGGREGLLAPVLFMALHEAAHAIAGRLVGLRLLEVRLGVWPAGAAVVLEGDRDDDPAVRSGRAAPRSAGAQLAISLAGPLSSVPLLLLLGTSALALLGAALSLGQLLPLPGSDGARALGAAGSLLRAPIPAGVRPRATHLVLTGAGRWSHPTGSRIRNDVG